MNILIVNKFLFPKGGDASSALNTGQLLSAKGHEVFYWGMQHPLNPDYPYSSYFVSFVDFNKRENFRRRAVSAFNTLYSLEAKRKIEKLANEIKPDIVHLHSIYHQISPSIIHSLRRFNVPIIMTLHDYKLVCASYLMLSKNKICELCKGGRYYHCFLEGCTKDSKAKSLLNTLEMYLHHSLLHIYDLVDVFISPSEFLRSKIRSMGFKPDIIHLRNFVNLKEFEPNYGWDENYIVYFGRLSKEKGLSTLIDAAKGLDVKIKIVGDGPIKEDLILKVKMGGVNNIEFLGYKTGEELKNIVKKAMFVILPSEWYENNPLSIIEGFVLGKPTIASRAGGIPELVKDGETGLTFNMGNSTDLRLKMEYLIKNQDKIIEMGKKARAFAERELSAEKHYEYLMQIYNSIIPIKK